MLMVWRFQIRQSRHFNAPPRKSKRLRVNIMLPTFSLMSHFHSFFLVISAFLLLILHSSSLKTKWFSITYYFYLDLFPYMEYLDVSS